MPRIPFTDLASSPEFKALPPEDQQVVATGYWDEVAAERPDQAEFYKGIRDVSKSLLDAKTERADASPVQRRFLDARVQDLAFDLSLGDEFAQGRLTQEGYTEALKVRNTESAQRQAPLDKTRDLFSDDPAKQKALAIRLDGLEQTATTGGIFGKMPFNEILFNTGVASRDAYAALKEQTAKDYGMEPDEVEDLVKHRLGFQEKPVSRDAVGNPFIKPEILAQGPDAVKQAILNSDLPWREKQRMTAEGDLKERMDGYYKSTMEGVKKNHSELYKLYKLDLVQDDPKSGFSALTSSLNQDFGDKFASGFTGYTFGVAEQVAPAAAYLDPNVRIQAAAEGRDSEQAAQEARGRSQRVTGFARRAQESVNQLSREFYKNQGTLWGVDASAYGSGAGSVLTAVGLGMATGGLALPVTSARVATMGPSALRMLNGANSVMRASPSIGLAMAQTGTSTYENALKSGKSEEEAGNLATLAGATEGVITGLFSLLGVGGLESVGEQLIGTAARQAVRDTAKSGFRTFGEKMLKGVTAEQFEEGLIAAFDSATVQARINPNMTVEDFQNTLRETALVTLAVSGPTIGMGALKQTLVEKATYQQTDDEVELRADLNLADATDPLRDRVRREGGVGTPLGERLRLTRPSARGTVPLEGTIPSDVVTDVNGVPVIPDDATNRIDTTAAQPGQANIPPAGQGPANAPPDSGAVAPGASAPVAPGGTQPVAPAQGPTGAPAAVPGVQPVGAAQPVLVRSNAEVDREMARRNLLPPNPMLTPEERQADLQNRAPDLAAPAAPAAPGLSPQAIAAGAVPAPTRSPAAPAVGDSPTPTPVNRAPKDQSEQELYDDWVTTGPYGGPEMVTVYRVAPVGADPTIRAGTWVSANTDYLEDYAGADWRSQPHEILEVPAAHLRDAETGGGPGDTLIYTPPIPTPTTDETKVEEASGLPPVEGQPVVPSPAVQAEEGTAQREGQGPQEVAQNLVSSETPGDTKPHAAMLDEQGVPKRLFHGKAAPFENSEFQIKPNQLTNLSGLGPAWFSTSRNQAERFVGETPEGPGEVVEPTRIDIRNPLVLRGSPESVAATRENRKILDLLLKIGQITNESVSDEDFETLKQYLLERGVTSIKNKRTEDLQPWTGKVLVGDEAARVSRKESSDLMQGTHPDADPFGQLKRLLKEAEVTLSASGIDTKGMTEGEMLRRALELEGKDGIVLLGTMADTKVEDEPSDWVIPFRPDQLVFDTPAPATPAAETPAVEEAPAETFREPEPTNWSEVFEVLNDRDPDTKPINTESSKFRELVNSLKDTRVGELAGRLFQKKADVAELEKRIKKERKERDDQRKERNRFQMENKPLDVHQKKIKELTKGGKYPDGIGHGNSNAIKQWLVDRGMNPKFTNNKDWRAVALRERNANSTAKTDRIRDNYDAMTDEAKVVVDAFHKMGKKPVEEKESLKIFFDSKAGQAIQAYGGLKSKKYFTDRGLPIPNEYDGLDNRVPPHIATAVFKNSGTAGLPDQVAGTMGMDASEFWIEFWAAVNGQTDRVDKTLEDYNERKLREAEDREIAFAEQQIKALENEVQTVDLREVRDGDKFTLGGTEYTATGVEADKRGQTKSFMLFAFNPETYERGPLSGTRVSEDFFAESVTPTKGSLAHVDPAEIEAINIAQAFPEEFEDAAEPAPTATEPEVAPTAGPVPYSPEALKETFDVSDEQAVAMDALVQAMGLDTSRIQLQRGGFQTGPDILYQETSSTKWGREKFDSLPDQSKKNLAINIVDYGWNPAEFGMTDADVQTWAAEGLAKRAARLAEETAAEARSRAVLEKSKTAPPEASLVTEADLQESQLPDDGYFYHVTTPAGARAILKSRRIASGKRQSMADGYYAEYSRGKVFFTDRGGVSYWQGKISDHLEAQGRSGKTVTIRIPKHAVGDLKVDEPGTLDARTPAWFSPENVLFQNQQGTAKGSFEQLPETGDILLRGLSSPDVSTGVHEIAHAARRTILNRDTPAEARAGITDADIAVAEEWAGAKDGVWTRAAEEKFARGWERYLRDGKSPVAALQGVFDKMAAWLRSVYVTVAESPIDVEISPEMRAVFDKLVSRTLPQAAAPAPQAAAPAPQPQATTPPPPAEPTPPRARPVQPGMAEVVSTQNAATDAWREANGFPPIFKNNPVTFTQYWQDAQKLLKQDPDAGKKLVARMKKELFQPETSQVMLILNEMLLAKGAMERALYERNLQGESATADQIAAVNDALAYYAEMTLLNSRVGSIQATAFGARKVFVTDELDIGVIAGRIQHAQGGKELSKEQSAELQAAYAKIKEFEDREKVREAEAAEDNAQQVFENMVVSEFKKDLREGQKQGEKPLTTLQRKAQESREWLRQNIGGRANMNFLPAQEAYHVAVIGVSYIAEGASAIGAFVTRLIKDFGNRYVPFAGDIYKKSQELHQAAVPKAKKIKPRQEILDGIDPGEMVNGKAIYQLVRHYVNEGLQTFEEVMTAVHADLQLSHPNLTMREVHDAFSNYGIVTQPSQEKDAKTTRKYREMARYSSQLEDAMAKDYPKKTGPQRDPQAQEVRDLAKQVRDTIRKFNLRPENGKEQLKSTFDAIKTRLKNEFEDYDTAVKKGEERKAREPQKFTAEEEAELKDLRQKRDDRKKDYEAIFKKKGLTTEQRIERMEALLDRRIEEERKMLEEGILKRDREMQMGPWTPALRKQQETLNKLKADRRERQKAARPKKPEDLKDYERKLKSLDKRIKEEEDLLAAGLTARQKNFKMGRWTPEMAEMQARLDALRDDRRELAKKQAPKKSEEQTAYERSVRAIEAAIQRYNDIINAIKKPGKPTFTRTLDAEMQSLLDQRDALRDAADAVLEADPERKDKRKQDLLKVLNKSINEITRKIQDGDLSTKTRKPGEFDKDPDVVRIREARDLLNKTLAAMRKVDPDAAKKQLRDMIAKREAELSKGITLPDTEEDPFAGDEEIQNLRTALDLLTDIKRIKTSTAKIQARLDAKDYTKSVKPTPKTSKAREDAIMEHNRLKSELNRMVIQTELDNRSFGQLVADRTKDLLFNVSRTLNTSADAGTIGRQTQLVAFTRPGVWAKSLPSHFAFAKKHAERVQARVENHPDYDVAVRAGMNLGSWQEGATFEQMNEEMRSEVLRLIPGVGKVAGAVVDASIRAYVSGINSVRMPYFSLLYRTLIGERKGFSAKLTNKLGGVGLGTQKEIEYLARHVEIMTGRGNLGAAAKSAELLSQILFSPRYWLSRLQIIGHFPVLAADLMTGFQFFPETRAARKVVAMEYARMVIGVAVYYNFLSMVKHLRGWDDDEMYIEWDPRSSDFGKIKIGNTRIDPMAGMLQNIVFVSRTGAWMLRGTEFGREAIDGDKIVGGKLISMRDAKQDKDTMASEVGRMIRSKLAPWPSAIWNMAAGEDAVGNKVRVETEILGLYLPLSQVEIYNAMQEHGANPGLIYSATNLLGWGVSTYGPGTKKTTLEQDAFILMGVDQSRYERDDAKKAPGWKIPKSKGLPTF